MATIAQSDEIISDDDTATDALSLLRNDHEQVENLFDDYNGTVDSIDEDAKGVLVRQICAMLTVHAQIEEEIFYPALRGALDEQDVLDEAEVEHATVKELVDQLEAMEPGDDLYDAKVKVLSEYVKHHVEEEEESMFPLVEATELDLDELGSQLLERKEELMDEYVAEDAA